MIKTVNCVGCVSCKKIHLLSSKDFISVYGNINVGLDNGIVGNNIENDKVVNVSIYCNQCFIDMIKNETTFICSRPKEIIPDC